MEYKILHVVEGGCGTILLGASSLPLKKIEAELNREAAQGWRVVRVSNLLRQRD